MQHSGNLGGRIDEPFVAAQVAHGKVGEPESIAREADAHAGVA